MNAVKDDGGAEQLLKEGVQPLEQEITLELVEEIFQYGVQVNL